MLSPRSRQHDSRGDDRRQMTRARTEAEALFRPKRLASPATETAVRKPRVLATMASPAPGRSKERTAPASSPKQQATIDIPPSQIPRIRVWVEYGMTVPQVAEVCGVAIDEVERVLRRET